MKKLIGSFEESLELRGVTEQQWMDTFFPKVEVPECLKEYYERQLKSRIALEKLVWIIDVQNQLNEWVADWADGSQPKYAPWPDVVEDSSKPSGFGLSCDGYAGAYTAACVGSRLSVGSREECKHVFLTFTPLYEAWMLIDKK